MKQIVNIWMQPIYSRMNLHSSRFLLALLIGIPILSQLLVFGLSVFGTKPLGPLIYLIALGASIGFLLTILLYAWFILLVMNIGLQYSPANAKLVPNLKRKMQLALGVPMFSLALVVTIVFSVINKQIDGLPFFTVIIFTTFFVLTAKNPWAVIPFVLSFQLPLLLKNSGMSNPLYFVEVSIGLPVTVQYFVFGLVVLLGLLAWFFSMNAEAHFKMYQRCKNLQAGAQIYNPKENQFTLGLGVIYFRLMQRQLTQFMQKRQERVGHDLSIYVFGPKTHWSTMLLQTVTMVVSAAIFLMVMDIVAGKKSDFWQGFGLGFGGVFGGIFLIAMPLIYLVQIFYAMHKTSKEQGLICLAPAVGSRAIVDATLMSYILRQFLIMYGIAAVTIAVLIFAIGNIDFRGAAMILFLAFLQPCALALAAQHSGLRAANDSSLAKWCAISMTGFIVGLGSFLFVSFQIVFVYFAVVSVATILEYRRRLNKLKTVNIFPVGAAL